MIDFHCHLDLYPNPHKIADDCRRRRLFVLSVTTTPSAWEGTKKLSRPGGRIHTALGLHPQLVRERYGEMQLFQRYLADAQYIGEIGLDGSPENRLFWDTQVEVFDRILRACSAAGGRIMSIHSRRATSPVLERLEAEPAAGTAVLHWFSGTVRELERAVKLGCWFSVGPAMLFSEKGRALAAKMPRDRVLTETDGPFAQIDGRAVLPWETEKGVNALADLWKVSPDGTKELLGENLRNLTRSS